MPRALGAAAIAVVTLALTPSTAAASTTRASVAPACALLTVDDIHTVLGGTVGNGDLTTAPAGGETICQWTIITSKHGDGYSAQLDVKPGFTNQDFKQQRAIASGSTRTVRRLGRASFSERVKIGGQIFDDLWVHTSDVTFRLEVLKDLGAKPLERLARIVLANLAATAAH